MLRLRDARLCITDDYGGEPFGSRGRLSDDAGKTWGD